MNITRSMEWQASGFDPTLPPPLCFTRPAGSLEMTGNSFIVTKLPAIRLRTPKLMMDPSDPMTWQRDYRFS